MILLVRIEEDTCLMLTSNCMKFTSVLPISLVTLILPFLLCPDTVVQLPLRHTDATKNSSQAPGKRTDIEICGNL